MDLPPSHRMRLTRRAFLGNAAFGLGSLAASALLGPRLGAHDGGPPAGGALGDRWPGLVDPLHYPAKAKRVIWLGMMGGPSQFETFDHKPGLAKLDGMPMPESFTSGQPIAQLQGQPLKVMGPHYAFARHGRSGQEISELLPHTARIADDICIIRSMHTDAINHDPAQTFMNTGSLISGRPSMGSWLNYGLGSACEDLPGFIVLTSVGGGQGQPIASRQWHSGFLPGRFQGVPFHSKGDAVLYVRNPAGVDAGRQREVVDSVRALDLLHAQAVDDPEIATRISQYEMAFRMQTSVPGLMDVSDEPKSVLDLYGATPGDGSFASNCLLARRLAERGVRFIQLYHRDWDHHGGIRDGIKLNCRLTDQGSAALITDLKARGMLDDTLVVWGGEFGRTPMAQADGRDHHIRGFSMWLAGGGIKGGITHGATDELGYHAVTDPVSVHDLHATMLRLMGIEHTRLTYRFQGRDFRLTDVAGQAVERLLA